LKITSKIKVIIDIAVPILMYQSVAIEVDSKASQPQDIPVTTPIEAINHKRPKTTKTGPIENGFIPRLTIILLHGPGVGGPKYFPFLIT